MRRTLKIAGFAIAALLLVAIALPFLIDANRFRPTLESRLSQALGRDVKVGNLKLALLSGGVTADDLAISDDPAFSHTPFVQAKSLHVGVDLAALIFSRALSVTRLTIDQPQIWLLQSPTGDWNFSSLGTKSAARTTTAPQENGSKLDLSVKLVKLSNGRFTLGRTGGHLKPLVLESVNAELHDFAAASSFPFSVAMTVAGGGAIQLDGKAGPMDENDVAVTPATMTLKVDKLDLAGSGLNEIAPELAGLLSFDGNGQSGANGIELNGKLQIDKLKLSAKGTPATRVLELDFHVAHDLKKRSGRVRQGDIHIGKAVTRLIGTYVPQGDSFAVDMTLEGPQMPVQELEGMLPALGVVLPNGTSLQGGTAGVKATIQGPIDRLVIVGSIHMNDTKLAGFNLSNKLSSIEKLAGIAAGSDTEIQELSGNVKVAPDGIITDSLKLVLPAIGDVSGGGTVNPDNTLNFKMQAAVHTSGLAAALNNEPVPFTVEGTCAEPVFHPDIRAVVKDEIKGVGKAAGGLLKGLLGDKSKK
jgi:AsmA protein